MQHKAECIGVDPFRAVFVFQCECGFRAIAPVNWMTGPRPRVEIDGDGPHTWSVTSDLLSDEEWRRFGVEPLPMLELGINTAQVITDE